MPSKAVNRPTNTKQKEQDINQKLQLYGIYHAFKSGKLPSNKQCDVALNSAINSKDLSSPSKELSGEGQQLVKDLRNVIEQAKRLILSKNEGQLLQDFIWAAETIGPEDAPRKPAVPGSKESAQQDANKSLEGLKTLGTLIITNGEFRKLLNDAMIIARDIAGDVSAQTSNVIRPSEEELAQVDQPAEENVWHEKPDISMEHVKSRFKKNKEQAGEVAGTAKGSAAEGQDVRTGAAVGADKAKEKVSENVPEETTSGGREFTDRAKGYISDKFPQERRDQIIWRLKKMVLEIQGHPDYQEAVGTLLSLAEKYAGHAKGVSQHGAGAFKEVQSNEKVRTMETNLRILLERFANATSFDDFFNSLDNVYQDAEKDHELRWWFQNMDTYIRKILQQQNYIMEDESTREWDQLYDRGSYLLRDRYKNHTDRVLDELKFLGDQFNQDPQNRGFREALEKLFNDLGRDANGKVAFKKHLVNDIKDIILPAIFEKVRYIPIPRIEVDDPMADVVIENLVIESDNLMPNVVEYSSDNYLRWGRKNISSKRDNKTMISVSGIQADLRDVSYYIRRKQGFPAITDIGIMDIILGGEGFGFKIAASTAQKEDRQNFLKLDKVTVQIHNMDIKLRKSKHRVLFTLFKPMLFNVVRPIVEKVLEKQIRDAFIKGDAFAFEVQDEVKRAQEAARETPENAPNIYSLYLDAARTKLAEKKQQAAESGKQRDTKIQTVTSLQNSMFPHVKLPGGVTTKATEYEELAKKGERWESPIFSIGSAAESKDIPKLAGITRKSHSTADGRLTDGGHARTNGQAGANGHAKSSGYPSRGFSDELQQDFSNGTSKVTHDGPIIPGTPNAFNPQTA